MNRNITARKQNKLNQRKLQQNAKVLFKKPESLESETKGKERGKVIKGRP